MEKIMFRHKVTALTRKGRAGHVQSISAYRVFMLFNLHQVNEDFGHLLIVFLVSIYIRWVLQSALCPFCLTSKHQHIQTFNRTDLPRGFVLSNNA